jgi:Cu+-exporting ATPase
MQYRDHIPLVLTPSESQPHPVYAKTTLYLNGMQCSSCAATLDTNLKSVPGIEPSSVIVTLMPQRVVVSHDLCQLSVHQLCETMESFGFEIISKESINTDIRLLLKQRTSSVLQCTLALTGVSCASCVQNIETNLKQREGILSIQVNLVTSQVNLYVLTKIGPCQL